MTRSSARFAIGGVGTSGGDIFKQKKSRAARAEMVGRVVRYGYGGLVGLVLGYLLLAVVGAVVPGKVETVDQEGDRVSVLLVAGPIHYDFLLPLTDEARAGFAGLEEFDMPVGARWAEWVVIGWGAREFCSTTGGYGDLSADAVWRSFTGDAAVLRVDVVGELREGLDLPELRLSAAQYRRLIRAVGDSFLLDENGRPIPAGSGFGQSDQFFAAKGRFDALRTCNTWISRMIHQAGHPFGAWTPTPYAVTLSLAWFGQG